MAMRFFDITEIECGYVDLVLKQYGLDASKLLYANDYFSMGGINSNFSGRVIDTIKSNKKYLLLDDTFTFFDSLYGAFNDFNEVSRDDVKLFPTMLCKFNKHFGEYYTIDDVYSLFSSRFCIFGMFDDFKDDVRLSDVVYFTKYESTFSIKFRLDGRDISISDTYTKISTDELSDIRNKINIFNSVLNGYYLETKIKAVEKYLNQCVIGTVIIGD